MHPGAIAASAPGRSAIVMGRSGDTTTYADLDARSNRLAHVLRRHGLGHGDGIAIALDNDRRFLEVAWAAQRSGLYFTTINHHLRAEEAAYVAADCGAKAVVSTTALPDLVAALGPDLVPGVDLRLLVGGSASGWQPYEETVAAAPSTPVADEAEGDFMGYSSGTTGRPKGIRRPLTLAPLGEGPPLAVPMLGRLGFEPGDTYLCPAPLHHTAPLVWSMGVHRLGGTVVVMERFDAAEVLQLIERHQVTHAQVVPTMFVRLLALPEAVRVRHRLDTLRAVVHAAAPCPVEVKRRMLEWWGPIIHEYFGATEANGGTWITPEEWLVHPGSVGKPMVGAAHVLDDAGDDVPNGVTGTIWWEGGYDFEYHGDREKTEAAKSPRGWSTVGDLGHVDDDGYLYIDDRRSDLIIVGGVNVYPRRIEEVLASHASVVDAAVIGVPDEDLGQRIIAVVEPAAGVEVGPALEFELLEWCRGRLARFECPRAVDFDRQLPRADNGKLYKRLLVDRYC